MGRIVQYGGQRPVQLVRTGPAEAHPHSRAGLGHLPGDDRLIVADGRHDQRQSVGQRLAHGVVAAVAQHGVEVRQQGELRDVLLVHQVVRDGPGEVDGGGQDQLCPVREGVRGTQYRGVEAGARLAVEGAEGDQHPRASGIEPVPREVVGGRAGAEGGPDEDVVGRVPPPSGPDGSAGRAVGRPARARPVPGRPAVPDEFGGAVPDECWGAATDECRGGEDQDEVRGETWVPAAGRPGFGEQRRDALRHPLPHLGDTVEGPGELGRGGRRGRPGQTVAARHQRPGQGLLVGHQHIRRKGFDGGVHAGQHRAGERDEDLRPQEAQGRDAP